jgi:phage FluMu protein Com
MAQFKCSKCGHQQAAQDVIVGKKVKCPICQTVGDVITDGASPAEITTSASEAASGDVSKTDKMNVTHDDGAPHQSTKRRFEIFRKRTISGLRRVRFPVIPSLLVAMLLLLATSLVFQALILQRLHALAATPIPVSLAQTPTPVSITGLRPTLGSLPVSITDVSTTDELPVSIEGVRFGVELPVSIDDTVKVDIDSHSLILPLPVKVDN